MPAPKTPRVEVTVRGHRVQGNLADSPALEGFIDDFALAFGTNLQQQVGDYVGDRIGSGKWWTKHSKRFARYRSWVKEAYGSDRARKKGGARRTIQNGTSLPDMDADSLAYWGNAQHLMVQWLARKLAQDVEEHGMAGGRRKFVLTSFENGGMRHYDVSSAMYMLQNTLGRNEELKANAGPDNARLRMKNLADAISADNSAIKKLQQSRYGQKLYRLAQQAALTEMRKREAAKAGSTQEDTKQKKANRAGNFKWGVQTGTLAGAWKNAQLHQQVDGSRMRFVIQPDVGDRIQTKKGMMSLTKLLLRKQGPQARLLTAQQAKTVVRRALKDTLGDLKGFGYRVKLRK